MHDSPPMAFHDSISRCLSAYVARLHSKENAAIADTRFVLVDLFGGAQRIAGVHLGDRTAHRGAHTSSIKRQTEESWRLNRPVSFFRSLFRSFIRTIRHLLDGVLVKAGEQRSAAMMI